MKKLLLFIAVVIPAYLLSQTDKSAERMLYDPNTIGEIRIKLPATNWVDALDSMRLYGENMMNGTVEIDGKRYAGAGVRFRGNNSYQLGLKRNPLQIKLNYTDKDTKHQGYTSLKLSSALRDPSLIREMLFYQIARKYTAAPRACYSKLYINDEYVGLFVNVESVDGQFLREHYNSDGNAFFKAGVDYKSPTPESCRQNIFGSLEYEENLACYKGNFEMSSAQGWLDLQELTRVLNQNPENIETVLDVDCALWMLALNNAMVNLNSYSGNYSINYYLYKDNFGRFQTIPWDLNLAFGSFKNTGKGSDLDLKELQKLDPLLHADNPYKPLISKLLANEFYKKMYLAHLRQILEENFTTGEYETLARAYQSRIAKAFEEDPNKSYSTDEFQRSLTETIGKRSKIPGIIELMSKRSRYLKSHPDLTALPSIVTEFSVQGRGKFDKQKINMFKINVKADRFPQRIHLYYRFGKDQPYRSMLLSEDTVGGLPAGAKAFTALVDAPTEDAEIECYVVAENAGAVSFFPANYRTQPKKVKISDLNK